MATPFFRLIPGSFVLIGKEPDGDSVRFRPDDPADLAKLARAYLIRPSKVDGSVQLRFDGIDATELHYKGGAQPFAVEARDALLKAMGWTSVTIAPDSTIVTDCVPTEIEGVIFSKAAEANGRPVSFVLVGEDAKISSDHSHHGWTFLDRNLLEKTMNFKMLASGMAYPTFYTSLAQELLEPLREVARAARADGLGLWPHDSTPQFRLVSQADIDENSGNVILPKLFRRATDYLKDVGQGFLGTLGDWIAANGVGNRSENDRVEIPHVGRVALSTLVEERNDKTAFLPDLMEIVFVEK